MVVPEPFLISSKFTLGCACVYIRQAQRQGFGMLSYYWLNFSQVLSRVGSVIVVSSTLEKGKTLAQINHFMFYFISCTIDTALAWNLSFGSNSFTLSFFLNRKFLGLKAAHSFVTKTFISETWKLGCRPFSVEKCPLATYKTGEDNLRNAEIASELAGRQRISRCFSTRTLPSSVMSAVVTATLESGSLVTKGDT